MENNTEFFNLYVEKILTEVSELTRTKLILQTQIAWKDKQIQDMTDLQNKLQEACNFLETKLRTMAEKKSKKSQQETETS